MSSLLSSNIYELHVTLYYPFRISSCTRIFQISGIKIPEKKRVLFQGILHLGGKYKCGPVSLDLVMNLWIRSFDGTQSGCYYSTTWIIMTWMTEKTHRHFNQLSYPSLIVKFYLQFITGPFYVVQVYRSGCTHLIIPKVMGNEKFLAACAAGMA